MSDISVRRSHNRGQAWCLEQGQAWARMAEQKFDVTCTTTQVNGCPAIEFKRSGVQGVVLMGEDFIDISAKLGLLFKPFAKRAQDEVGQGLDKLIAKGRL
ncbi:polyhydroxyalkanoic acid system family protein [Ideonella livida]|uniref:Polyhydroxyalkanoic acid synthase n=1 Tax=Ideonella livida TaxID=2707176 RepID=A0A7C9TL71_9BURK|nr:polyhydroxyalkanoic acid system family protein [Ideonella livida]NDY92382.1 hypothetical protein [Ideonella livida]